MTKVPYHQKVATQIIESLKQGTAPWLKPWEPGIGNGQIPHNPVTGKRYRGINALYLMMHQSDDNRWLTYNQAQSIGAQVRKGEMGTTVQYWKFNEERIKKDEMGNTVRDEQGEPIKVRFELERPKVFYARVFHASQIDNMPELTQKEQDWSLIEKAESLLANSGANIVHSETDRAFYKLSSDSIHLPPKAQFKSSALYYATALHELGHWSGHSSRLDRDLSHPYGSDAYAKEELRAEIASMLLGAELGIGHDPSQHTAYIKSWIRVLEDDPLEIFRASADAEKIVNLIYSLEQVHEIQHEQLIETRDGKNEEVTVMKAQHNIPNRTWLDIPYHKKDTIKVLAGKLDNGESAIAWDKDEKRWYAKENADLDVLAPWLLKEAEHAEDAGERLEVKTWLSIPFKQKNTAKSVVGKLPDGSPGLGWDKQEKSWYAKPGVAIQKIKAWLPENNSSTQEQSLSPIEEFKETLINLGAIVSGEHPIMDGKPHRIAMEGDKGAEKAGFYVGHLDGIPAGYIKNNRTGVEYRWKCKGYVLTDEQKNELTSHAAENRKNRQLAVDEKQLRTALMLTEKIAQMSQVTEPTPYITSKGIQVHSGIYTDDKNKLTCVPATDIEGKVWTVQYIAEDGTKRFAKDSKKDGCFHVLDGIKNLANAPVIVIAEGYATAATIKEATDLPAVVSAFDAGNLKSVAKAIHQKYPRTPIVIAADDDKHLEMSQGVNPGKEKAIEAARVVDGYVVAPIFNIDEQWNNPKKFCDFNDMANCCALGSENLKHYFLSKLDEVTNELCHSHLKYIYKTRGYTEKRKQL